MPEGHTVHRTANDFNRLFKGQTVTIASPQGRFTDAALVSGRRLIRAWAIGKQLFLKFEGGLNIRIHLGIYGKWSFQTLEPDALPPEPIGQVRARFSTSHAFADLRGPTVCEVIDDQAVKMVAARLGPDPLNPDKAGIEAARFVERVRRSATPIGLLLMNQDVIAGIGNVYRAEILFRAGIEPHTPGSALSTEQLYEIWRDAVELLKVGVAKGVMITRDDLRHKKPTKAEQNWVYKRQGQPCYRCGAPIAIELMAARKLYWCPNCQKR